MATAFHCAAGLVQATFGAEERSLLLMLVTDLGELVRPFPKQDDLGIGVLAQVELGSDPVLNRLFPSAYADAESAAEFRRLTEQSLRSHKAEALAIMRQTLGSDAVALQPEQASAWLGGLNDIRLALGTRIGIGTDAEPEVADAVSALYDWLTWMQDCLITAIGDCADTLTP